VSGSGYECRDRTWWGFPVEGNTIALDVIVRTRDGFREWEGRVRRRECIAVDGPGDGGRGGDSERGVCNRRSQSHSCCGRHDWLSVLHMQFCVSHMAFNSSGCQIYTCISVFPTWPSILARDKSDSCRDMYRYSHKWRPSALLSGPCSSATRIGSSADGPCIKSCTGSSSVGPLFLAQSLTYTCSLRVSKIHAGED
jgi:hypothetical protein